MELTVGAVLEGKVKSITNFGAFITLPENKSGLVHISEVANTYVSDIHQHLTEGQEVKVVVIGLEGNKINLSIKRLEPKPQRDRDSREGARPQQNRPPPPRPVSKCLHAPDPHRLRLLKQPTNCLRKSSRLLCLNRTARSLLSGSTLITARKAAEDNRAIAAFRAYGGCLD